MNEISDYINYYSTKLLEKNAEKLIGSINNMEIELLAEKKRKIENDLSKIENITHDNLKKLTDNYVNIFTDKMEKMSNKIIDNAIYKLKAIDKNINEVTINTAECYINDYMAKIECLKNKTSVDFQQGIDSKFDKICKTYQENLNKSLLSMANNEIKTALSRANNVISKLNSDNNINNNNNNNDNTNRTIRSSIQKHLPCFDLIIPHNKHSVKFIIPDRQDLADKTINDFIEEYYKKYNNIFDNANTLKNEIENFKSKQQENFAKILEIIQKETENNNKELYSVILKNIPTTIIITNINNIDKLRFKNKDKCKTVLVDKISGDDDYVIKMNLKNTESNADVLYQLYKKNGLFTIDYQNVENEKKEISSITMLFRLYARYNCNFDYYYEYFINNNKKFEDDSSLSMIDSLYNISYKKTKNLELYKADIIEDEELFKELKNEAKKDTIVVVFKLIKQYIFERDAVYCSDEKGDIVSIID